MQEVRCSETASTGGRLYDICIVGFHKDAQQVAE